MFASQLAALRSDVGGEAKGGAVGGCDASGASLRVVAAVSLLEDALRSWQWQLSNGRHESACSAPGLSQDPRSYMVP